MDSTLLFNQTNDPLKTWMFNNQSKEEIKSILYNIPVLYDDEPIVQCALNTAVTCVLETFQDSLNDDGYIQIESVAASVGVTGYVNSVTELAILRTCHAFERMIDDDDAVDYDYGLTVTGVQMLEYVSEYIIDFQEKVSQFVFLTFTGVILHLVKTIKELEACVFNFDTYTIKRINYNPAVIQVNCHVERTQGLLLR